MYSACGATLFSFYLAHHTKLIVAGKHSKYQMNEKDYVYGAVSLFNDIINLFIYVLKILGEEKDHWSTYATQFTHESTIQQIATGLLNMDTCWKETCTSTIRGLHSALPIDCQAGNFLVIHAKVH